MEKLHTLEEEYNPHHSQDPAPLGLEDSDMMLDKGALARKRRRGKSYCQCSYVNLSLPRLDQILNC